MLLARRLSDAGGERQGRQADRDTATGEVRVSWARGAERVKSAAPAIPSLSRTPESILPSQDPTPPLARPLPSSRVLPVPGVCRRPVLTGRRLATANGAVPTSAGRVPRGSGIRHREM